MQTKNQKIFEQNMEEMSKMSLKEMAVRIKEFHQKCICGMGPTYMGTGEEKLTFCVLCNREKYGNQKREWLHLSGLPSSDRTGSETGLLLHKCYGKELAGMQ